MAETKTGQKLSPEHREKLKGKIPWNKGLTKETDIRVKQYADKLKGNTCAKNSIPWNKGLTKETDERVLKYTETHIETLKRPDVKEQMIISHLGYKPTKETKAKMTSSQRERWKQIPNETRQEISKKIGIKQKQHWDSLTSSEREEKIKKFFRQTHPNGPERFLIKLFEKYSLLFIFHGTCPYPGLGGKMPDFVHKSLPLIIEYDGIGGHDPLVPWVPDNQPELDDRRDSLYRKAGYNILRLLPDDLQSGEEHIVGLIKNFEVGK